jgi:hypothetical protein
MLLCSVKVISARYSKACNNFSASSDDIYRHEAGTDFLEGYVFFFSNRMEAGGTKLQT